jgi:tetratricopeptide (TPR) repeat protein
MKTISAIPFLVSFLVSALFPGFCAADQGIYLTEDLQLLVADSFLEEGEYYRAVTEYKRFGILFPGSPKGEYALFRTGMACFLGDEHGDALRAFQTVAERYPDGYYRIPSGYFAGLSLWKKKDFAGAAEAFEAVVRSAPGSPFAARALAARSLMELDRDDPAAATAALQRFADGFPDHPEIARVREAQALLRQYEDLPQKSELLAGVLSAILPGAGYVYAGRYGDGLTSFLVNALFIAATVTAVRQEWYPAAGIAGGIGLPFYLGNIYGSVNAARKWNRSRRSEMRARIEAVLGDLVDERRLPPEALPDGAASQ